MNDIKFIINYIEESKKNATIRGVDNSLLDSVRNLYEEIKKMKTEVQEVQAEANKLSKNKNISIDEKKTKVIMFKRKVKEINVHLVKKEEMFKQLMDSLPNLDIIHNHSKMNNELLIRESKTLKLKKTGLPHWEIYKKMSLVNFEWGVNVGGSRSVVYTGNGAKLRRALINYQVENATKNGFTETFPPSIVTNQAMYNSAHFPKFKEDVFQIKDDVMSLTGSSETSICNFFANKIIDSNKLPLRFSATTLNFRSEVGSAGRDVRGCHRMKQFTKTEMFILCKEINEEQEFNLMLKTAESILVGLDIPYKIICLTQDDMAFSARITYDFEAWMPGEEIFKEVSSVSRVGDFQARRSKIRHREKITDKVSLCRMLNGTAVAIDRLMACVVETYYDSNTNTIKLPNILIEYYGSNTVKQS